jgi:nitrate reductase NapE component
MPFSRKRQADNWRGELKVFLLLGFCSFPLGCLQFCPFYHWPHDIFHIPSEV